MKSLLYKNKKAQLGILRGVIISIMTIGILLGIGFLIFGAFQEQVGDDTGTVLAEEITLVDYPTGVYVAYNSTTANVWCYHDFAITNISNATDFALITTGNYSYNSVDGQVWNVTTYDEFYAEGIVSVAYTYQYGGSEGCRALNQTVDATRVIPQWLTIIIILIIVGLLLVIVFRVMPQGGASYGGRGDSGSVIAESY